MTDLTRWILTETYTKSQALACLRVIRSVSDVKDGVKGLTEKNFDEEAKKSEEEIKNMDVLTVFLAVEVSILGGISEIGQKIRRDFDDVFLLEFRVDPRLVAGCKLAWRGKMEDFSLRRKMDEKQKEIRGIVLN